MRCDECEREISVIYIGRCRQRLCTGHPTSISTPTHPLPAPSMTSAPPSIHIPHLIPQDLQTSSTPPLPPCLTCPPHPRVLARPFRITWLWNISHCWHSFRVWCMRTAVSLWNKKWFSFDRLYRKSARKKDMLGSVNRGCDPKNRNILYPLFCGFRGLDCRQDIMLIHGRHLTWSLLFLLAWSIWLLH